MRHSFSLVLWSLIALLFVQCAKRGNPTGGPDDETPPVLLRADPALNTTHFNKERIRLYFDEYIKLQKLKDQLIVSPPLDPSAYTISPQSTAAKYVQIELMDTLRPNTTYNFNFGQSIVDNNEGNPYPYFRYVFSTGDYVDSLQVRGTIGNAFAREPKNFVSVMLYAVDSTYNDSIIYQQPPDYLTNTLDSLENFEIGNVKAGRYLLIAQKDIANNYNFDQNADDIGFINDFIDLPTDSLFHLDLFREKTNFSVGRTFQASQNRIGLGYYGKPNGLKILPLNLPDSVQTIQSFDKDKDTLYVWYKNLKADSLQFDISQDTLKYQLTHQIRKAELDSLTISTTIKGVLHLDDTLGIETTTPILTIDKSRINLRNRDSMPVPFDMSVEDPHRVLFDFDILPNENYQLDVFPGAITDFFDEVNDSLQLALRTKKPADYGSVYLQLVGVPSYPIIVQLTDENEKLIRSLPVAAPQRRIVFSNLQPKKYYVRLIVDENKNGQWDTGRFLDRRAPEKVYHHEPRLDVRANWELQEIFILK
ncbi:MAG: Ig-like domain-containing protein [Bacteroidota bacterium]|nr:Ig-like domain-containing protein [Bacteroidota bacterium]